MENNLIEVSQYGEHDDGKNTTKIRIGHLTVFFSYQTPVAFRGPNGFKISENIWTQTTGKHLNAISDDKRIRIDNQEFERLLAKELEPLKIALTFAIDPEKMALLKLIDER